MPEVQRHGFDFENWVKDNFFSKFDANYTQKWDIPKESNCLKKIPVAFRNLPVSIKTCKYGSPIGFGDALRQYNNDEDFLLIVGFWKQDGKYKNFVAVEGIKIHASNWRNLFSPLDANDLNLLVTTIKNPELHYSEARKQAGTIVITDRFRHTKIVLNRKIDSKKQRRLQCSLPFSVFWENFAGKEPYENSDCALFGTKVPNPFLSGQRIFKQKPKVD